MYFGALVGGLGCFPLDDGTYLSPSHCRIYIAGIRSLTRFGTDLLRPHRTSALPPVRYVQRGASTPFGENQLAPGSIGISPLCTAHPLIFQHQLVRTSTHCYIRFILAMHRSPGFGPTAHNYYFALIRLGFPMASHINCLTNYVR